MTEQLEEYQAYLSAMLISLRALGEMADGIERMAGALRQCGEMADSIEERLKSAAVAS